MTFIEIVNEIRKLNPGVEILLGNPDRDIRAYYRLFTSVPNKKLKLPKGVKNYIDDKTQYNEDDLVIITDYFKKTKAKDGFVYDFCIDGGYNGKGKRTYYDVSVSVDENPSLKLHTFVDENEDLNNSIEFSVTDGELCLKLNRINVRSREEANSIVNEQLVYKKDKHYCYYQKEKFNKKNEYLRQIGFFQEEIGVKVIGLGNCDDYLCTGRTVEDFLINNPDGIELFERFRNFINQIIPFEELMVNEELIKVNGLSLFFDTVKKIDGIRGAK